MAPRRPHHARNDGLHDVYGTCTKWCYVQTDFVSEPGGNPVADHGLWCATTVGYVQSRTADGFVAHTHIGLARPYFHGTYPAGTMKSPARSDVYVELELDEHEEPYYFTIGEARRLIAFLQRAVDELDGTNRPIGGRP